MTPEIAYKYLFEFTGVFLLMYGLCGMFRSCRGPEVCDKVMGINMIGTAVIGCIMTLVPLLKAGYLADIAVIYALVNFVSVVILRRVYGRGKRGTK